MGHIVCKDGMLIDPTNIVVIIDLLTPTIIKQLRATLGYTGYYQKFIKGYATIIALMEKLLK